MKIGIIGAGHIGGALTHRLTELGHEVRRWPGRVLKATAGHPGLRDGSRRRRGAAGIEAGAKGSHAAVARRGMSP
jgi:3-hydroxyisobutyrate dehydrogenase-like beta-hydroxyacid dehydrogenase